MNSRENKNHLPTKMGKFLIIAVLTIGILLRFANLDQKVYSADEVRKILWLSGYSSPDFIEQVFTGDVISASELKKYQQPNSDRTLIDAIKVLSTKTEHVPLHHIITRFWLQLFGNHPSARVISILLSLLSFPCLYWLCLELFNSSLTGWIAIAIVAVSPFHILSSQNTGSYGLWTVTILFSSAAILRALRVNDKPSWLIYAVSLALGFYTHLFSLIIAFGQGIYVLLLAGFKFSKTLTSYLLSATLGLVLFSPWLAVFWGNLGRIDEGTGYYDQFPVSFSQLLMALYSNIGKVFIDFFGQKSRTEFLLHLLLFILIVYTIYFLIRQTTKKIWLFVIILIVLTPIIHIIANFHNPSALHVQSRYYLPCFIGIQLSVAYLLASQISSLSLNLGLRRLWQIIFLAILILGMGSGIILSQARDAGLDPQTGTASGQNLAVAPLVNQAQNPLVISNGTHSFILALLYLVDDKVKFQLLNPQDLQQWQQKLNVVEDCHKFSDVFVLYANEKLLNFIRQNKKIKLQKESIKSNLYKVTLISNSGK